MTSRPGCAEQTAADSTALHGPAPDDNDATVSDLIAERLRDVRTERGWTAAELAAARFRAQAERVHVVGFHPLEVVLGLGILHAEHRIGVGFAVHMGDAPVLPVEGDVLRLLLPARDRLWTRLRLGLLEGAGGGNAEDEDEDGFRHAGLLLITGGGRRADYSRSQPPVRGLFTSMRRCAPMLRLDVTAGNF